MIFRPLFLLPSAALYMLTIWPFGFPPPRSPLRWRPHKQLCFDWSSSLSTGVFLSIRANVRPPSSQWIPIKLTFSPTSSYSAPAFVSIPLQLFLGSPSTAHFPFLSMYLRWRPSFSHASRPYAVSLLPHGAPLRSPSPYCIKLFFGPFLTYASPGWFPFLSATNLTKLERLHQAVSRAITGCLSTSPIPHLFSEASLPPLRVTLTHFILLSYERALRLPTSFPISGLARLSVRPRLSRSSWRAFASTHPLMLPSTSFREALLACPPFPPWNVPFFIVESTLFSPCSRSDPLLSCQGAALAHLDSLPPHDLVLWTDGFVAFPFGKGGSGVLANCSFCGTKATLSFSAGPVCSSFSAEVCAILHALCWSRQHQQVCHFSSLLFSYYLILVMVMPPCPLLHFSSYLKLCGRSGRNCLLSPPALSGYNGSPDTRFSQGTTRLMSWPDGERYLRPPQSLVVSLVVSLLWSLVSTLVLSRTGGVLSHRSSLTHRFPRFPSRNLCSLVMLAVFSLVYAATDTASCEVLISLGLAESRILPVAPVDTRPRTPLISFCTVQLRTRCVAHSLATLCLFTSSGPDPGKLPGFWGSMVFRHTPIPRKRSGNQQQQQNGTLPAWEKRRKDMRGHRRKTTREYRGQDYRSHPGQLINRVVPREKMSVQGLVVAW